MSVEKHTLLQLPDDAVRILTVNEWEIYKSAHAAAFYVYPTSYHASPLAITQNFLAQLLITGTDVPEDLKAALTNFVNAPSTSAANTNDTPEYTNNKAGSSDKEDNKSPLHFTFGDSITTSENEHVQSRVSMLMRWSKRHLDSLVLIAVLIKEHTELYMKEKRYSQILSPNCRQNKKDNLLFLQIHLR